MAGQHRDTKAQRRRENRAFQGSFEAGFLCVFVPLCLCVVRPYVTVLPKCCTSIKSAETVNLYVDKLSCTICADTNVYRGCADQSASASYWICTTATIGAIGS